MLAIHNLPASNGRMELTPPNHQAIPVSFYFVILSIKPIVHAADKFISFTVDVRGHINRRWLPGAGITYFFKLQFMIDK